MQASEDQPKLSCEGEQQVLLIAQVVKTFNDTFNDLGPAKTANRTSHIFNKVTRE